MLSICPLYVQYKFYYITGKDDGTDLTVDSSVFITVVASSEQDTMNIPRNMEKLTMIANGANRIVECLSELSEADMGIVKDHSNN